MTPIKIRIALFGLSLGLAGPAHAGLAERLFGKKPAAQAAPAPAPGASRHETARLSASKTPRWQRELDKLRGDAESGKARFGDVFARGKLLANIKSGREEQVGFDKEGGAQDPADARSKFVMIRDFSALKAVRADFHAEHVLAVATPSDRQPISIFDVAPQKAEHLGRMVRAVLKADQVQAKRGQFKSWFAHVSLPDKITIPYLHVHGEEQIGAAFTPTVDSAGVRDWGKFLRQNGYTEAQRDQGFTVHVGARDNAPSGWEVIAVADAPLATGKLDGKSDELLGKMVLAVGQGATVGRGITGGHIEVQRDDQRLVVRAVNYQSRAFDVERAEMQRLRELQEAEER